MKMVRNECFKIVQLHEVLRAVGQTGSTQLVGCIGQRALSDFR